MTDLEDRLAAALEDVNGIVDESDLLAAMAAHGLRLTLADAPDDGLRSAAKWFVDVFAENPVLDPTSDFAGHIADLRAALVAVPHVHYNDAAETLQEEPR